MRMNENLPFSPFFGRTTEAPVFGIVIFKSAASASSMQHAVSGDTYENTVSSVCSTLLLINKDNV